VRDPGTAAADGAFQRILAVVADRRGIDFRDYRPDTLWNRLESRMRAAGCVDLATYHARLIAEREEIDRLVESLVVPVTEFFRDGWVFRELTESVLPALPAASGVLRAWVVGTATGEEAYTLAMILAEAAARQRGRGFEVLASDLDQRSLEVARRGLYSDAAVQAVPPDLRKLYLRSEGSDGWRVVEPIRGRVHFAQHDLMGARLAPREAIVAAFHVVFCRNVLLYFDASLRAKAVDRLAAVLEPGGALVIGVTEALPEDSTSQFTPYPGVRPGAGVFRRASP
jgi:two-component system, chemotaxis family, CheB/CheR fusion protein